ncbi:type II toxin-antitoxin system VapC family toxin [Rathayibacter soli]|uniref:type II toxin-antitoxin system VapC family toxin n=1 Tax=Rathayibacter soli TaxID=3144168 RepID=UPI0027E40296|nr:type II toxin-antitoxin system VapC family toxin [Glaciibacter superstes]
MNLLLDTHILLWAAYSPHRLSQRARQLLEDAENRLVFSAASIWEVAIKTSLGKPGFSVAPAVLRRGLVESGYFELDVTSAHAAAVVDVSPSHTDPFDRILVAQARVEGLTLLTSDLRLVAYGAEIMLV